jgi:hypothetical protein
VRIALSDATPTLEFGVSAAGYSALKGVLNARPFDSLPGIPYRYYFSGSFTGGIFSTPDLTSIETSR